MAKLRNIQFLRNNTIAGPFDSYGAARTAAESAFGGLELQDGEIALYSYKLTTTGETVHTLFGIKRNGGIEILGNYDELTAEYQSYVTDAIEDLDGSATIATQDENGVVTLKTGIVQTNGVVDNITDDEGITLAKVATTGAAADVSVTAIEGLTANNVQAALAELQGDIDAINEHTITAVANQAVHVTTGEDGNTTIGLVLTGGEKVLSQTADGLKTNLDLRYDSTTKKIQLLGKTTGEGETATAEIVGEINATDFIKDGMLADATIVSGTWADGEFTESETGKDKAIKFVWKTYQQGQSGQEEVLKTEYLNVESLVDAYTSGNDWIEIDGTNNTISHKELFEELQEKGSVTTAEADAADESVEFAVPTIKIDEAGHVIAISDNTVKVTLPASIATAVQTVTSTEAVNATDKFVAVHATREEDSNEVVLTSELKIKEIATATADDNGLATALDVRNYVDTNSTTVSGYTKTTGEGESAVSTVVTEVVLTENENGSANYQVKLPEITVQTPAANSNSMDNETNTHTYMTGIETDGFGRVTKVITETMREDINCGTY